MSLIAMDPIRWKLAIDNKMLEQVEEGIKIKISGDGKIEAE
jgi:hypothetical protein